MDKVRARPIWVTIPCSWEVSIPVDKVRALLRRGKDDGLYSVSIPVDKVRALLDMEALGRSPELISEFQSPWIRFALSSRAADCRSGEGFQSPWIRFAPRALEDGRMVILFQSPWIRFALIMTRTIVESQSLLVSIPVDKVRAFQLPAMQVPG